MASKKSRKPGSRSQTVDGASGAGSVGRRARSYRPNPVEPPIAREVLTPVEHYRREKSRREEERRGAVADPLEEARREYRALLAADAAKQKGGRPKKTLARPSAEDDEVAVSDEDTTPEPTAADEGERER